MLNLIRHPAETPSGKLPLVIGHGLFGSGRNWGVIARRLADTRDVIAVDQRNHGESPRFPVHDYPSMAAVGMPEGVCWSAQPQRIHVALRRHPADR